MGKRDLADDPRYDDENLLPTEKETLFNEYIATLNEVEKRKKREETALKEREREAQKLREKELRNRDRIQQKSRDQEGVTNFQILLKEKIRDPDASWTKNRRKLEEDPRWTLELPLEIKERIFRDHVKTLQEDQANEFRNLLAECAKVGTIDLTTKDFEKVKQKLRDDPRYESISSSEKRAVFDRFLRDLRRNLIGEFLELLTENKNEGNISSKSTTTGPKFEKIKSLLKVDKRYTQLNVIAQEREQVLINFIEKVLDKGDKQTAKM